MVFGQFQQARKITLKKKRSRETVEIIGKRRNTHQAKKLKKGGLVAINRE